MKKVHESTFNKEEAKLNTKTPIVGFKKNVNNVQSVKNEYY